MLTLGVDWNQFRLDPDYYVLAYYPAELTYSESIGKVDRFTFKDTYLIYDHPGKDFVKYLKELKSQSSLFREEGDIARADELKAWLDNFTQVLRNIFGNDDLNVVFDVEKMTFFIEEPGKNPFAFDELASGYAAILDIITDLMMRMEKKVGTKYDMLGFVLIDEVDAHLHLSLQKNILPTLTTLFPNIQFIVTTHSPFVLNSIANAVVYNIETNTLVNTPEGLSKLPYYGIVEGYFGVSELSVKLQKKFERYKKLSKKTQFTDEDYNELSDLESYLDEIPDFLALDIMADYQQIKLELSTFPPLSLAKRQSYNEPDTIQQLKTLFNNKCYICEMQELQDGIIEHLIPHRGDPDLKFDWRNLFWACNRCNSIKNRKDMKAK